MKLMLYKLFNRILFQRISTPASLVDVGAEVSAGPPPPTDAEILDDVLETDNISDDELVDDSDDAEDVPMEFPRSSLCLQPMVILFSLIALSYIGNHFKRQGRKKTTIKD